MSAYDNLWEQMSENSKIALAALLGFYFKDLKNPHCAIFKSNLMNMDSQADNFTIGEALNAYINHLRKIIK